MKVHDFLSFVDRSPTPFHAAKEIADHLAKAGFSPLQEQEAWQLKPASRYFVMRGGTLVAAFKTPQKTLQSATLLLSHLDSPALKLKPTYDTGDGRLAVEVYGAPILHSWLDRDLYIAGEIFVEAKKELVSWEEKGLIIPQLALHLDRTSQEKGFFVNKEEHLKPIFALDPQELPFPLEQLLSFDLFLAPREKASLLGAKQELIASARLDNLTSVFAALSALANVPAHEERLLLSFFFDHEEIGSESATGASSRFAEELLERIALSFHLSREDYFRLKSRSFAISGDLAHGFHPAFSDKFDRNNAPSLGKGPVIKYNASQKYATSAASGLCVIEAAERAKIPLQRFASRADLPSGSTVGPIIANNLGIPTADVGIASWAMHSIRETIAASDLLQLALLFEEILKGE